MSVASVMYSNIFVFLFISKKGVLNNLHNEMKKKIFFDGQKKENENFLLALHKNNARIFYACSFLKKK